MTMTHIAKTLSHTGVHIVIGSVAAFVMTGRFGLSLAVALLESVLLTLVHPLHEWAWARVPVRIRYVPKLASRAQKAHFV
jgi:uncharacterized membrane protein